MFRSKKKKLCFSNGSPVLAEHEDAQGGERIEAGDPLDLVVVQVEHFEHAERRQRLDAADQVVLQRDELHVLVAL